MYEMYPDAWTDKEHGSDTAAGRPSVTGGGESAAEEQPRRRARKEHQVAPRVLRTAR